jgi:hypothetical protein
LGLFPLAQIKVKFEETIVTIFKLAGAYYDDEQETIDASCSEFWRWRRYDILS